MDKTRTLRLLAVAEAVTLLILFFIAMPLKRLAGIPEVTAIMGPIHGLTFIAFLWAVVRAMGEGILPWRWALRLVIGAMIPFGGLINERWLAKQMQQRVSP